MFSPHPPGVCSSAGPADITPKTRRLLKVVALAWKLRTYETSLESITLTSIVSLLECVKCFPEFAQCKDAIIDYHAMAKCQVCPH